MMVNINYKMLLITLMFLSLYSAALAEEISGREIMENVDKRYTGDDESVDVTMTLIKSNGRKRVRKVKLWRKSYGENDKSLMRFFEPADVRGSGFLVWEHKDKNDDQWLYLPALKKVRRISAQEKEQSFMGTDFSYEDLASFKVDDYKHTLLKSEEIDGDDCFVVQSVPEPGKKKSYRKTISWIRKDIFFTIRVDFYDKNDNLQKKLNVSAVEEIDGVWTAQRMEMTNIKKNHQTILELENIKYNTGLSNNIFTERNLVKE
jgi:outer membrane lipoprotein-sorting protein